MVETPKKQTPKKRASSFRAPGTGAGAKPGNRNAVRHGLKGSKLPAGCQFIENRVNGLRRQVEDAVFELKGEINFLDAAAINSVLKWERHGTLAAHWLRKECNNLSPSDRLRFSAEIAKASDNRDKALRLLGLDAKPLAPWLALDVSKENDDDE